MFGHYGSFWFGISSAIVFKVFNQEVKHGMVRLEFANGDVYEGEFADGTIRGKGVLTKANGEKQEGKWSEDNYSGSTFAPPPNEAFSTGVP